MRDVEAQPVAESHAGAGPGAASYEEFVGTRGPALFRSAWLLTGSTPAAETLLQAALVRLRVAWPRAPREPAETLARRLLVRSYLSWPPPGRLLAEPLVTVPPDREPDPDPVGGLRLWPRLADLAGEQRAVLVLAHADGLGDHQIAALLGGSARSVAAAGSAGFGTLLAATRMDADALAAGLEAELREVAESRPLPDVLPEGLARAGAAERVRRRKRLLAAATAAAAVVLAVVLLPGLAGSGSRTGPPGQHRQAFSGLARGPDTTLPWWGSGELHVGGTVIPTDHHVVLFAGGTTLVGDLRVDGFEHDSAWWLVVGDGLLPLTSSTQALVQPEISPQGDLVAWVEPDGPAGRRLVLWSASRRQLVGTLALTGRRACCGRAGTVELHGIDPEQRVVFETAGHRLWAWSPGGRPRPVRGVAGARDDVQAWPGGLTWRPWDDERLGPFPVSYGILDGSGRLHAEGATPEQALWAPDGARYAWTATTPGRGGVALPGRVRVRHLLTGSTLTMRLPPRGDDQLVGWESADQLVVAVRRDAGGPLRGSDLPGLVQLVRCDADTGACQSAGLAAQSILDLSEG